MTEIDRALSDISDIRSRIAASTRFRGYGADAVAATGALAAAVMFAQLFWPARFAAGAAGQAMVWGVVLVVGSLVVLGEATGRARAQHAGMAGAMLAGAARTIVPISFLCAALGAIVLLRAPEIAWILPGTWQMLIGVAAFSSYAMMPRGIVWPGLFYLASGATVLFVSAGQGQLSPIACGVPFIVGHLWIAALLDRETGARA
jgi:hypothetical protein